MDIESQRPYPTSTFFSNESGLSKEPTFASTGAGVAALNTPKVKVSVAAPSHYPTQSFDEARNDLFGTQ